MPRLGINDTDDEEGRPLFNRRGTATAYAAVSGNASAGQQLLAIRVLLFFMVTLIARNALVRVRFCSMGTESRDSLCLFAARS